MHPGVFRGVIGVIAKAGQTATVEEFFELFKTPWEAYRPGRAYDVVVATVDEIPDVAPRLLALYGAGVKTRDARDGIVARSRQRGGALSYRGTRLPIYGEIAAFEVRDGAVLCVAADDGAAGLTTSKTDFTMMRLGYDLFAEVELLLSAGQPVEHAGVPTLDLHITMLREWILNAGITLVEIPPAPAGHGFCVCLTHDIDFAGIRNHRFDHTMWGFLYRSTVGAARNLVRGRLSMARLFQSWRAAASLPFVYLGWAKDFWEPFDWYLRAERNLPATYFLIPFKRRPGERVASPHASRRGAAYDVGDLAHWTSALLKQGCELGVHGIDAWNSAEKGRHELGRIAAISGEPRLGVRMHWLLRDENTAQVLEDAGYDYDASLGYNETVGYRNGTSQVFRPSGVRSFLEIPLHIQDGALFFPDRLDLSESDAWKRCEDLMGHAGTLGGVLTVLWHDRSHGPERFWGDFYVRLIRALRSRGGWFGTAREVVRWFGQRREISFERVEGAKGSVRIRLRYNGGEIHPPLSVRVQRPDATTADVPWNGETILDLDCVTRPAAAATAGASLR
jgi:peptidoglycan/xylan/chitin deacetylase (PgdA/CDA1 family)